MKRGRTEVEDSRTEVKELINNLLEVFKDPFTQEIINPKYALIGPDGHGYNLVDAMEWTQRYGYNFKSPLTNEEFSCPNFNCFYKPSWIAKKTYSMLREKHEDKNELIQGDKFLRAKWLKSYGFNDGDTMLQIIDKNISNQLVFLTDNIASGALGSLQRLILRSNQIGDAGMIAFTNAIKPTPQNPMGALPRLKWLWLESNAIGDAGMTALADAIGTRGSLANLTILNIYNNQIGDAGITALAGAIASGALPQLETLGLGRNRIADAGVIALSDAFATGSLGALTSLDLETNEIGDAGLTAFASALRSGALGQLTQLQLQLNSIGDVGMIAFADAVRSGALPKLKQLYLRNNMIGDAGLSALASACASGALASLKTLYVNDGPLGTEHPALKAACQERGIDLLLH